MIETTIGEKLLQYGVFGIWTLVNLYFINYLLKVSREDRLTHQQYVNKIIDVIDKNTEIISRFMEKQDLYCFKNK